MTDDSFSGYLFAHLVQPFEISALVLVAFAASYWVFSVPLNSALSGWITLADNYRVRSHPKSGEQVGFALIGTRSTGKFQPPVMFAITKEGLYLWT